MRILFLLLMLVLVGCRAVGANQQVIVHHPTPTVAVEAFVNLTIDEVTLRVPRPNGWEFYETDYGVVLAEHLGSIATEGQLSGLLLHVFVHPLDDNILTLPTGTGNNHALTVLNAVTTDAGYIGDAAVSEPVPFTWNGQDAAYYLTADSDNSVTIVIGVIAPGTRRLVASNISAPVEHAAYIRQVAPTLLDAIAINGVEFSGSELDFLPDPLVFPQ